MGKKNRKKTEAQAFLDEAAEVDSQGSDVSESEGEEDSADQAAGEAGQEMPEAPKSEEVKPAMKEAVKAGALSPEVPGKYRKFHN